MNWNTEPPHTTQIGETHLLCLADGTYDTGRLCAPNDVANYLHWEGGRAPQVKVKAWCTIMPPADPTEAELWKSYNDWQAVGRQVRRGEKSTRRPGIKFPVFHRSQTDAVAPRAPKAPAAPAATPFGSSADDSPDFDPGDELE